MIEPGAVYTDTRDESEEWYIKYADSEVVVSRNTEDRYHRYERREVFEASCGLRDEHREARFTFTGETIDGDEEQHTNESETTQTKSLLDL